MKILLTGGGTAGHIVPHLALIGDLKKNFDSIIYIGSSGGIENSLLAPYKDITFYKVTTTKLIRGKVLANLLIPFKLFKGIKEAKQIIKKEQPNIVFSKGGFVSLPVVIAAKKLKVPVIIHESDLKMGLANKLSRRAASVILTTFEETALKEKKGLFTGSPMRDIMVSKAAAKSKLGLATEKPILVVTGGSLGAKFINDKLRQEIKPITDKYFVIHITGKNNLDNSIKIKDYRQIEFTTDIGTIFSAADVVVSRAGSNTIFELATLNRPMLLIPLPKGNSRGDQVDNAKYFNSKGYANFITEEQLKFDSLFSGIDRTYADAPKLIKNLKNANFRPGNAQIIETILKYRKP